MTQFQSAIRSLFYGLWLLCIAVGAAADWQISRADGGISIGPFDSRAETDNILPELDRNGLSYRVEEVSTRESLGFIVVTATYPDRAGATEDLDALATAGIKDFLFIGRGDYVNRISVGVFSQRSAAERRAAELNEKGFAFDVIERSRGTTYYAIVMPGSALNPTQVATIIDGGMLGAGEEPSADKEPSAGIEPSAAEQEPPSPAIEPAQPAPKTAVDPTITDEPAADSASPIDGQTTTTQPPPVVYQDSPQDNTWLILLFLGLAVVVIGALIYLFQSRRVEVKVVTESEPRASATTEPAQTQAAAVVTPADEISEPQPAPEEMILDYAEAVLAGRSDSKDKNSLTLLGTADTSISDLIQDLLFLTRLEEEQATLESFAFDCRNLLDNLVSRLSANASASLQCAENDDLPQLVSMDASKLNRILTILLEYAVSRTESGAIFIGQAYKDGQLAIDIRFNPARGFKDSEIETLTNPARSDSMLDVPERVRLGVANRLAAALGGRIDAKLERGDALIAVRCPAAEVMKSQLVLPSGQTIDELLEAEAAATAQLREVQAQAESLVAESEERVRQIESEANHSIDQLQRRIGELEAESTSNEALAEARQAEISSLAAEVAELQQEKSLLIERETREEARASQELEALTAALNNTREQLQAELDARRAAELAAEQELARLKEENQSSQAEAARELARLDEEKQAKLAEAERELTRLSEEKRTTLAAAEREREEKAEVISRLEAINQELIEARDSLQAETQRRAEIEQRSAAEVTRLASELSDARADIEAEKSAQQQTIEQTTAEVESLRSKVEQLQSRAETATSSAAEFENLQARLAAAELQLAEETRVRSHLESSANEQVNSLLNQLNQARTFADKATDNSNNIRDQLAAANRALEETRTELEKRLAEAEAAARSARENADQLESQTRDLQTQLETERSENEQAREAAEARVAELETALQAASQAKVEALAAHETAVQQATDQINTLTASLQTAEDKLSEQEAEKEELARRLEGSDEVQTLRQQLRAAEEQLQVEQTRRDSTESAAGSQIEELLDDLNQARREIRERESEAVDKVSALETRLTEIESAHETLKVEAERAEAFAANQTEQLQRAMTDAERAETLAASQTELLQKAMTDAERAEAFAENQTQLLLQAMSENEAAERKNLAARKVNSHLKTRIQKLEAELEALQTAGTAVEQEITEEELPEKPVLDLDLVESQVSPAPVIAADDKSEQPEEAPADEPVLLLKDSSSAAADSTEEPAPGSFGTSEFEPPDTEDFSLESFGDEDDIDQETADLAALEDEQEAEPAIEEIEPEPEREAEPEPELEAQDTPTPLPKARVDLDADIHSEDESDLGFSEDFQFDDKPIRSSRIVNNPVLHSMIVRFVDRLEGQVDDMEIALKQRDYMELVIACNWIRGEANKLGFEVLVRPVEAIEQRLRQQKFSQIITHLSELRNMAERLDIRHNPSADAPIKYFVPDHAKNPIIYENYVSQLGSKILEMEISLSGKNYRQMKQICRWIERYGSKIKFVEVIDAVTRLEEAIDARDEAVVEQELKAFIDLYGKIEIVYEP